MNDLFSNYPNTPGYKVRETSRQAAQAVKPKAATVRARCLELLASHGPLTADGAADLLGLDILTVRPRFSELATLGKVRDSNFRGVNASGKKAIVWVLA